MPSASDASRKQGERHTKAQLVEAAERLFGRHGLEGVSLRQIAAAAGSSNPSVVQYHFGDKLGLVRSIFSHRLAGLEARRGLLLAEAQRKGKMGDPRTLLHVLLDPLSQECDRDGQRSYAAFLLGIRVYSVAGARDLVFSLAPLSEHIVNLLRAAVPATPERLFRFRLKVASCIYWQALVDLDAERQNAGDLFGPEEAVLAEALDAGAAMLTAAVSAQAAEAFAAEAS
ncbi:MAG: TetR/AcrR family transcriptional regulator [Mycobacterium sp.]|uniref:TetR/AcrR family transcriptional regulator n=1 Tax=Mycobacterium sp. TaxID=1785 RepID=UPI001EB9D195|nr:TetR/AcrR family transcriptional regulator [Mycobacterium sp.]MBV8788222.1 TetR/AcrR family transcriptional regulator [Mycobacterium sp.]